MSEKLKELCRKHGYVLVEDTIAPSSPCRFPRNYLSELTAQDKMYFPEGYIEARKIIKEI